ncbi:EAL domain-containing protein [Neobacillus jeddahensis]|uniref:EAL domain-containing protein n=1 Tax=Neobacillus jeddahensis TaxID=1461580 RepID=UPI001FCB9E87|nr:EAL domain-containing protein [Neobacillus jeddahensis]
MKTTFEVNPLFKIYKSLFDYHHDACFALNLEGNFIMFNDAAVKLTGYSKEEALQMSFMPLVENHAIDGVFQLFERIVQGNHESFSTTIQTKQGKDVTIFCSTIPIVMDDNRVLAIVGTARNTLSSHDDLTGMPNRQQFEEKVTIAINLYKKPQGKLLGMMYLDLDRFRLINEHLGYHIGDKLLTRVSQRINSCIRNNDVAARQGSDEFLILLNNVSRQEISLIAKRISNTFVKPFMIEGHEIFITPSIGISLYPPDADNADDLIRKADIAMDQAKKEGRNNAQFYHLKLEKKISDRLEIENELRKAIEKNEFILHYQPIIDLGKNEITGVEALIRWENPFRGKVPPDKFIPIAEETGMIIPIGEMVLKKACMQMKQWQDSGLFLSTISVNISIRQFYQPNLVPMISQIINETAIDPKSLTIEITESMTMDVEKASKILHDLKGLGVNISIDDFGTGYSSLSYLKKFPIDYLKIDRSFINDIAKNKDDENIATTILLMAQNLGLSVIAEGVETNDQLGILRENRCDEAQGFLFSKPLAEDEMKQLLSPSRQ